MNAEMSFVQFVLSGEWNRWMDSFGFVAATVWWLWFLVDFFVLARRFPRLCGKAKPDAVRRALAEGKDVNAPKQGWPALFCAALANPDPEVIRVLTQAGADIRRRDYLGMTALMWAARCNHNPEVVKALLLAGSDAHALDKQGRDALWHARRADDPRLFGMRVGFLRGRKRRAAQAEIIRLVAAARAGTTTILPDYTENTNDEKPSKRREPQ